MKPEIMLIGNEGFRVTVGAAHIYTDPFYGSIPGVAGASRVIPRDVTQADLILITHAHWDHFDADAVADVAVRTGASVVGPNSVVRALQGNVPDDALVELEPPRVRGGGPAAAETAELPVATVTAFRTDHSRDHNSYLVETPTFRFFHDGDNEKTRCLDVPALGQVDALLIGPWRGSGWVEFIENLSPTRYFLMHMTEEEFDEIDAGTFFPRVCDHVPDGLVVLRPGESFVFEQRKEDDSS